MRRNLTAKEFVKALGYDSILCYDDTYGDLNIFMEEHNISMEELLDDNNWKELPETDTETGGVGSYAIFKNLILEYGDWVEDEEYGGWIEGMGSGDHYFWLVMEKRR